jgi:hypothetical protein
VLSHLVDHRIGIFQLLGKGWETMVATDQGQRQRCDLSRVARPAGHQRDDLLAGPAALEQREEAGQVLTFQDRFNGSDKF